jgi:hypothetical protein
MDTASGKNRAVLLRIARGAMFERDLFPDFSADALHTDVECGFIDFKRVH